MDRDFWDACGIIRIDYLERGKTTTAEYYLQLLDRFDIDLSLALKILGLRIATPSAIFSVSFSENPFIESMNHFYTSYEMKVMKHFYSPRKLWVTSSNPTRVKLIKNKFL